MSSFCPVAMPRPDLRPDATERTQPDQEAIELLVGHPVEQDLEVLAPFSRHLVEYGIARLVRCTRTTRRSPGSRRRSTNPRASIRSMIPVRLATDTSRASASFDIGMGPRDLQDGEDMQMNEAQRASQPVL